MATKRRRVGAIIVIAALAVGGTVIYSKTHSKSDGIEYRSQKVVYKNISSSVSANGVLQPLTTVEVKSNVGGQVVQLAVDEGDSVRAGQLIARIDPADSLSALQQSQADMAGAVAKVEQSRQNQAMTRLQTSASIKSAEQGVEAARQRLAQAEKSAQLQPQLTDAAIKQAESALASAKATLQQTKNALTPQKISAAKASYDQAKTNFDLAKKTLERQKALFTQGFVPRSQVDSAEQQYNVAESSLENASQKWQTVKSEADEDLRAAEARVDQAQASLDSARANRTQDEMKHQDVAAARASLKQAEASLASARAGAYSEKMRGEEITQSKASLERTRAALKNAQTQLDYTTVVAPRDGVVVKKYVDPGSIVTAGKSSFSGSGSGVTIVDIADVSVMQALVNVDETDIRQISLGQKVDIVIDAYPDDLFSGKVVKIAPEAIVDQNVTTVPVTVQLDWTDKRLKPTMNVTCDFITDRRQHVLVVPNEAIKEEDSGYTVKVMVNGKPVEKSVEVGLVGNEYTEIKSGLSEGDRVVTAEIKPFSARSSTNSNSGRGGGRPPF